MSSTPYVKRHDILEAAIQIHNEGLKKELQEFMQKHIELRDSIILEVRRSDELLDAELQIFKEILHIVRGLSIVRGISNEILQ